MFGSLEPSSIPQAIGKGHSQAPDADATQAGKSLRSETSTGVCAPLSSSPQVFLWVFRFAFCLIFTIGKAINRFYHLVSRNVFLTQNSIISHIVIFVKTRWESGHTWVYFGCCHLRLLFACPQWERRRAAFYRTGIVLFECRWAEKQVDSDYALALLKCTYVWGRGGGGLLGIA